MRVYVSSHDRWAALYVAAVLGRAGHQVVSSWHDESFGRTASFSEQERASIAQRNYSQIGQADALVLIASPAEAASWLAARLAPGTFWSRRVLDAAALAAPSLDFEKECIAC